ncbi:4Fe-4S dicluster domain-containing protein [Spirosoma pulveris]
MSYFKDIQSGIRTTLKGLSLTLRHLRNATKRRTAEGIASDSYFDLQNGLVTLQYPYEQLPIPDNGRYRLRNEIEDCIVCDKCAKVCPVDCITIDAIKATEEVGRASDGSPIRLYAAKFDIDMAKCCYCGLCTVVCPTECLTMDKKFDYSEFELGKLTYNFSNLTPDQADEKRALYEQFLREKEEAKAAQIAAKAVTSPAPEPSVSAAPKRPVFKPTAKPAAPPAEPHIPANSEGSSIEHPLTDATPDEMQQIAQGGLEVAKHPVFRPTKKPVVNVTDVPADDAPASQPTSAETPETPKPAAKTAGFRPTMKPPVAKSTEPKTEDQPEAAAPVEATKPTPAFRPTMKPPVAKTAEPQIDVQPEEKAEPPKPKPAFRPTMKPPTVAKSEPDAPQAGSSEPELPKAKPAAFKPTMKPPKPAEPESATPAEAPKPTPAFRPTMKPATVPQPPGEESPAPAPATVVKAEEPILPDSEPVKPKPAAFRPTMKPKPKADDASDTPLPSDL